MPKIFIATVVACVMVIAGLVLAGASLSQYVAVLISLLALIVSITSAFKEDIFPFQPSVLLDEIVMAPTSGPSHNSVALVLPLTFINRGNGAGIIHMAAIKIEYEGKAKLYTPIAEIDYQKYLSGMRKLHGENILGTFNSFALAGKATLKKFILFAQEEKSDKYPFSSWSPGNYTFRVFINQSNGGQAQEVCCLGPMQITTEMLANYSSGCGVSLCPSRAISV
ncbi:MAG: hypothetical protein P4L87_14990 [Formivibrio sp.]|nr:hypothetical protein [Formivibrio sp.]